MTPTTLRSLALVGFLVAAIMGRAQPVLGPTASDTPLVPSSLRAEKKASMFALPGGEAENEAPLHWGPVDIKPHLLDRFIYSDGLLAVPGHPTNTYINTLSLGALFDIGRHWTFDYTPSWIIYTNKNFQNSIDHSLRFAGGAELSDWLLQFSEGYSRTNTPLIETGRQTRQEVSATSLGASHAFNNHLSLDVTVAQTLQFIEKSPDYYDWSNQDWLTYKPGKRVDFSLGLRIGYTDFDPGAYMTYSEPEVRVRWRAGDKVVFNLEAGREHRQIHKHGIPAQDTPTLNAVIEYQPFEHTSISLKANRSVTPSYSTNSVAENRGWGIDVDQRFFGRFNLTAGYSSGTAHYVGSHTEFIPSFTDTEGVDSDGNVITITTVTFTPTTVVDLRNDSIRTLHLRLGTSFLKRGTIALVYERNRNISDIAGFSFTSHQMGCEVGYSF